MTEIFLSRLAKRPRNKTGDKKGFFPKRPSLAQGTATPQSRGMSHRTIGGFVMTNAYAPEDRKPLYHKWVSEDTQGKRKPKLGIKTVFDTAVKTPSVEEPKRELDQQPPFKRPRQWGYMAKAGKIYLARKE